MTSHRRVGAHRHALQCRHAFTQHDGRTHARWKNTLVVATRYVGGLYTPGKRESMRSLASRVNLPKDQGEQFIRSSPWDPSEIEGHLHRTIPTDALHEWTPVTWGRDAYDEPLVAHVHATRVRLTTGAKQRRHASNETVTLLSEKRPRELEAWLCWGVDDWPLQKIVAYAHFRWVIEGFRRDTKQALGYGDFEGRPFQGWHHRVAMVLLAPAFVAKLRTEQACPDGLPAFENVVRSLQLELGVQLLVKEHGIPRKMAEPLARTLHKGWMGTK